MPGKSTPHAYRLSGLHGPAHASAPHPTRGPRVLVGQPLACNHDPPLRTISIADAPVLTRIMPARSRSIARGSTACIDGAAAAAAAAA